MQNENHKKTRQQAWAEKSIVALTVRKAAGERFREFCNERGLKICDAATKAVLAHMKAVAK